MNILQHMPTNGQFLSMYDKTELDGSFHVARCLCYDHTHVLFQTITTRGYDDGFYLIPFSDIYRIDTDDEYTNRIVRLFQLQNQPLSNTFSLDKGSLLESFLCYAKEQKLVTSLFLEYEDTITGRISDVDIKDNCLCVEQLTDSGKPDGNVSLNLDCITKIICNSGVERCIEMLSKEQEGNSLS